MMYRFKSRATGDLIMTQPVGDRVLALMGKPVTPQGIIDVDQMAAAVSALEAAVAADSPKPAEVDDESAARPDTVSLRQRVWPMVEMIRRASSEKQPITWGT